MEKQAVAVWRAATPIPSSTAHTLEYPFRGALRNP